MTLFRALCEILIKLVIFLAVVDFGVNVLKFKTLHIYNVWIFTVDLKIICLLRKKDHASG